MARTERRAGTAITPTLPVTKCRAFTLMEMVVVCAVLIIIAAAIMPNLVAMTRSRSLKDLEGSIARLPAEARNEALKSQTPVQIRVSGTMLVVEQVPDTGAPVQVEQVDLGSDITIDSAQLNGKSVDIGSWTWMVYPDGSADSGAMQFSEGQVQKSLILYTSGDSRFITGPMPDQSQDQWPAGQLLQRS
jgi:type II secretory pathway pseudopilin PulG